MLRYKIDDSEASLEARFFLRKNKIDEDALIKCFNLKIELRDEDKKLNLLGAKIDVKKSKFYSIFVGEIESKVREMIDIDPQCGDLLLIPKSHKNKLAQKLEILTSGQDGQRLRKFWEKIQFLACKIDDFDVKSTHVIKHSVKKYLAQVQLKESLSKLEEHYPSIKTCQFLYR